MIIGQLYSLSSLLQGSNCRFPWGTGLGGPLDRYRHGNGQRYCCNLVAPYLIPLLSYPDLFACDGFSIRTAVRGWSFPETSTSLRRLFQIAFLSPLKDALSSGRRKVMDIATLFLLLKSRRRGPCSLKTRLLVVGRAINLHLLDIRVPVSTITSFLSSCKVVLPHSL